MPDGRYLQPPAQAGAGLSISGLVRRHWLVACCGAVALLAGAMALPRWWLDRTVGVPAELETVPVPVVGDRADDIAVWVNSQDPALSTIIGTNKSEADGGLHVYDLRGEEIQFLGGAGMNNVDLRYGFPLAGKEVALVTAGNVRDDAIAVYAVDAASRKLVDVAARTVKLDMEVDGSCMYKSLKTGKHYCFVTSRNGRVRQWELFGNGAGEVDARLVRSFAVGGMAEGCVADDELACLYIAQEETAIWKYGAEPQDGDARTLVDKVGGHLDDDVEGLAIYCASGGGGYLIASSQGNSRFVVYEREGDNDYVTTFRIVPKGAVDGAERTDGIEVTNLSLGAAFPTGLFVAHDGHNDGAAGTNFKLVSWATIARMAGLAPSALSLPAGGEHERAALPGLRPGPAVRIELTWGVPVGAD